MENATTTLYKDNPSAFGAILNTGSASRTNSSLAMRLWFFIAQFKMWIWFEPVSHPLNIDDLPTRGRDPPFPIERQADFLSFGEAFQLFTQFPVNDFLKYFEDGA